MSRWMMPARCSAASAARQLDRDIASFLQAQRRPTRQPRLEKLALVERHDRVEAGLPPRRQFDDAADPGAVHARAHPGLAHERRTIGGDGRDLGLRKFQHHLAALDLVRRAEQAGVSSVGHQHLEHESRRPSRRQTAPGSAAVARSQRRSRPIPPSAVRPRRAPRPCNCRCCRTASAAVTSARAVSSEAERSRRMSAMVSALQEAVHAVAAQEEAVVQRHRLGGIVEPHLGLDAERAGKDVRPTGAVVPHMIGGQAGEAVTAQPIGARVADVQHMGDAPAQHQRGEGASHSRQLGVALSLGIDPAIECIENSWPPRVALPWSRAGRKIRRETHAPRFRRPRGRPWRRQFHRRSPPPRPGAAAAARCRKRRRRNPRCVCAVRSPRRTRRWP